MFIDNNSKPKKKLEMTLTPLQKQYAKSILDRDKTKELEGVVCSELIQLLGGQRENKFISSVGHSNLLISAPTNSGKSLVGEHCLLQSLQEEKIAILVEPLRALAQEKYDELSDKYKGFLKVNISTGDYRLLDEQYTNPPPNGELIIATPERLEAIFRNPKVQPWIDKIGCVVIDEAHLVADKFRGATLEHLITTLKCLESKPRIVLLSATIGNVDKVKNWLEPCQVVSVEKRYPPLHKHVIALSETDNTTAKVVEWLRTVLLQDQKAQALIFVYQTKQTETLASELTKAVADICGEAGVLPYHSKLSSQQRNENRELFISGDSRVVITTSALAMGINLPCTHVLVRDLTFPGASNPDVGTLLQMMGRAGRGNTEGHAYVLCKPSDDWQPEVLQQSLDDEVLPDFKSVFEVEDDWRNTRDDGVASIQVSAYLSRKGDVGATQQEIELFFQQSLGGQYLADNVTGALTWLERHLLAWNEDGNFKLTVLGKKACLSVLPLPLAYGYTNLLRDLLSLDESDEVLKEWQPLDHLIALSLLYDGVPNLGRFSAKLESIVDAWAEKQSRNHSSEVPLLFKEWLRGKKDYSKAVEVFGSLNINIPKSGKQADEWARKKGYQATFAAAVLQERSSGIPVPRIEKQYGVKNLAGVEERWRDDMLWLLAGLSKLLDIKTFYFHLVEECEASKERIKRVKGLLKKQQRHIHKLMEQIKYCSALGPLIRDMQRSNRGKAGVGIQTIRKLEDGGIESMEQLAKLSLDDMVSMGIRRDIAERISGYIRRRRV